MLSCSGACALQFSLSVPLKMALELAKLINCDVANSDQENLDRLLEEYMCGGSDESGSDTDECNGSSSDEDDLFDDRRNDFDDAMLVASCWIRWTKNWRKLTGFGMYDYYLHMLYALSEYVYHIQRKHNNWMLCHCL